jgi:hypothetical protein
VAARAAAAVAAAVSGMESMASPELTTPQRFRWVRSYFLALGWTQPAQKRFLNDRQGTLLVNATMHDLDIG